MTRRAIFFVAFSWIGAALSGAAPRAAPTLDLHAALRELASKASGTLGVSVLHVESGETAAVHGDDWFPMMSVYKLPIAIHALRQAEKGALDLSRRMTLGAEERRPGLSPLARTIEKDGPQVLTVRALVSSVVRISDNTASDALLRVAGGPGAVQNTLRELGLAGINVDRYELEFAADYYGVSLERMGPYSLERFADAVERVPVAARRKAAAAYLSDRRDSAQPAAMAALMARLVKGELLDKTNTAWLLNEMAQMHSRDSRLRAGLPSGIRSFVRPGTSGETDGIRAAHNDNVIVVLPDGRHLVIAAFLKGSRGDEASRDATLAEVARTAYRWATDR